AAVAHAAGDTDDERRVAGPVLQVAGQGDRVVGEVGGHLVGEDVDRNGALTALGFGVGGHGGAGGQRTDVAAAGGEDGQGAIVLDDGAGDVGFRFADQRVDREGAGHAVVGVLAVPGEGGHRDRAGDGRQDGLVVGRDRDVAGGDVRGMRVAGGRGRVL